METEWLIDMSNDIYRYLDDIVIIDYPEFEKYSPDIYPAELHLNKAKLLAMMFIPAFTTNAMT